MYCPAMRPTQPQRPSSHDFDDLPSDLSFDAPPTDFVAEVSPYTGVDVLPDALQEAFQDGRGRPRKPGRKPPLDLTVPLPRDTAPKREAVPTTVCLSCGASPPEGGDCPHDEIARLDDASEAVLATVRRLQSAVAERHAQERALRRLISVEVSAGRGDIDTPNRPLPAAPVEREAAACSHCGHRPIATRAARRKALLEAQESFFFAAPPPPAESTEKPLPQPAEARLEAAPDTGGEAPAEAPKRKRGRPRKQLENGPADVASAPVEAAAPL